MAPFILANDIQGLEDGFTSVSQDDIFSVNPFKDNGDIRGFRVGLRVIRGKKTLGESDNLKKKIKELVTDDILQIIRTSNLLLGATVVNLNKGISEVKTNADYTNNERLDMGIFE